jgi:mannose-6-phosphate isomerase-like protein (cupin superfamily)
MRRESTYERWMAEQGVPVVRAYGVERVVDLPREPWPRLGGKGTFIKLEGMEGVTGMYVVEVPPGGALNPEKHLFEKLMYVLQGRGSTEIYAPGAQRKTTFEWHEGSLFAVPLNTWHRLYSGSGSEPAVVLGFTNAPLILDLFHNPRFVFGSDYVFDDRFDGRDDYYQQEHRYVYEPENVWLWETNFVPDVRTAVVDGDEKKGAGMLLTQCEMGDGVLVSHMADWPVGRYQKAHYHGAGATLLIVRGEGFSLMWPQRAGTRPYESGYGDKVIRVDWREGSVLSPPDGWFHQHFNTSAVRARQLAFRYGSRRYSVEFHDLRKGDGPYLSIQKGGTMIEYEDEDPAIRRMFEADCNKHGVAVQMPAVATPAGG